MARELADGVPWERDLTATLFVVASLDPSDSALLLHRVHATAPIIEPLDEISIPYVLENYTGTSISGTSLWVTRDGGQTWKNMGLKKSEHVSDIIIHPTNPDIVWVSAQGPLWSGGGERGLYKTTDGGETWKQVLKPADEWTGVTSLLIAPRNPDKLYAATWARQRSIGAYVGTNEGAGIHTSSDGGETWTELKTGLPQGNMGKIGMAISPMNPDVIYAGSGEQQNRQSTSWGNGVYKSENQGDTWRSIGLEKTYHIARVIIHPENPNIVFVAALGNLWNSSKERGVVDIKFKYLSWFLLHHCLDSVFSFVT